MKLAVIICAYNPDERTLARVVGGLKKQTLTRDAWDLLVVDNGSEKPMAGWLDVSWHGHARFVVEPEKGIARARMRGIRESSGDGIVFIDDDTIPDANYLETAVRLLGEYPFIGILGGYGRAEFQGVVEPWMEEFLHMYLDYSGSSDRQSDLQYARSYTLGPWIPPTAGVAVRRHVAEYFAKRLQGDAFLRGLGRKGKGEVLIGSEDEDLALCAVDLGLASAMTSQMKFTHVVPAWRLTLRYLERLLYSANYGTASLLVYRGLKKKVEPGPIGFSDRIRRIIGRFRRHTPGERCWIASTRGWCDAMAGLPFDARYS